MKDITKLLLITFVALITSLSGFAQDNAESIEKLSFMIGEWEGTGWILGKDQTKRSFSISEHIQSKADNRALVVEGLGHEIDSLGTVTDFIIHKAFGIISYNDKREAITMITFSELKGRMESAFVFIDEKKMYWSFQEANGTTIRFTEDFSTPNKWKEIGEVSMNGKEWYQFFEMSLSKN